MRWGTWLPGLVSKIQAEGRKPKVTIFTRGAEIRGTVSQFGQDCVAFDEVTRAGTTMNNGVMVYILAPGDLIVME